MDSISELLNQADEIGDKYLQFDGGLRDTVVFLVGAYRLYGARDITPSIDGDQAIKFANYFISKRHVGSVQDAFYVVLGFAASTINKVSFLQLLA